MSTSKKTDMKKNIFNSIPFLWAWSWLFFMQERFSQPDAT